MWITVGYLAPALLLLPRVGARILSFLEVHRDRGVQIESVWGTLALLLDRVGLGHAVPVFEFGAWDVQCRRFGLVIAAGLTSLVYPVLYTDLVDSGTAGHGRALAAAVARNVLLVVLYAFLVRRAVRPLPDATPAPAPEAPAVPS